MQAPGALLNAMFMWIGQGDSWTTWSSILGASVQLSILFGICLYFKCRPKDAQPVAPAVPGSIGEPLVPQGAATVMPGGFDAIECSDLGSSPGVDGQEVVL
jgi:hypothetical protein